MGNDVPVGPAVRGDMAARGLVLSPPCYRAPSLWWVDTVFCRAERTGPRALAASDLAPGQAVAFSKSGSGWIYEVSGWQPAEGESTWAEGKESVLALKPGPGAPGVGDGPWALDFEAVGVAGPAWPESEVDVSAGSRTPVRWVFHSGEAWVTRTVCLPVTMLDGVAEVRLRSVKPHSPRDAGLGPDDRSLSLSLRAMTLRPAKLGECEGHV